MKKFLLLFLLLISFVINSNAQVQYYRTTAYASATVYNGTYYWGDWEKSNMTIVINLNTDVVTIYSPRMQIYKVVSEGITSRDSSGGTQISFYVYDQDGDRGTLRLRIQADGTSQLYIDFSDIAWVYNVIRTN